VSGTGQTNTPPHTPPRTHLLHYIYPHSPPCLTFPALAFFFSLRYAPTYAGHTHPASTIQPSTAQPSTHTRTRTRPHATRTPPNYRIPTHTVVSFVTSTMGPLQPPVHSIAHSLSPLAILHIYLTCLPTYFFCTHHTMHSTCLLHAAHLATSPRHNTWPHTITRTRAPHLHYLATTPFNTLYFFAATAPCLPHRSLPACTAHTSLHTHTANIAAFRATAPRASSRQRTRCLVVRLHAHHRVLRCRAHLISLRTPRFWGAPRTRGSSTYAAVSSVRITATSFASSRVAGACRYGPDIRRTFGLRA